MIFSTTVDLPLPLWAIGLMLLAVVLLLVLLASSLGRRSGRRGIAQRLSAIGSRLAADPPHDDGSVETALTFLEQVTGAATEAVSESSADAIRLRRSLDTLQLGVVLCEESGAVVYQNTRANALMSGRMGDAIAAQAVTDLLGEAWRDTEAERTVDLYGPPRRTLVIRARIIDDGRRPLGVIAVIEDVSDRRRLEEVRRDFVANVSHELKTPMGALGLLAETLITEQDPDVAKRLADRIHHEAFRVSRIIDDLLDLTRIEAESAPPREPLPVGLLMAEASERVRSAAEAASILLEVIEPTEEITVVADRRQIVSAIQALLENAVTYSPEGAVVTLRAAMQEELIPGSDGEEATSRSLVRLSVQDHGVGIPAKDLDRIFERFYRVDLGRSRATGGTGLGLSIVRHVATNHQGTVEVDSREGEGSTFTLVIPLGSQVS
ncbi:MAG: ATP-binding protein [Actinomycetota bacterium]